MRFNAGITASCRTNDRNTDKGEVGGSSPPRPTIKSPINGRLFFHNPVVTGCVVTGTIAKAALLAGGGSLQ